MGRHRGPHGARHLPIERDGVTQYVPVDDIVAVHANAHYTYVFDGTAKLFCPLAISDVEARLDHSRFVRVHRSSIVNLDSIRELQPAFHGDYVIILRDGTELPLSRSCREKLEASLGQRL